MRRVSQQDSFILNWQQNKPYKINNVVTFDHKTFRCLEDHISSTNFNLDLSNLKWDNISSGNDQIGVLRETFTYPDFSTRVFNLSYAPFLDSDIFNFNGQILVKDIDYTIVDRTVTISSEIPLIPSDIISIFYFYHMGIPGEGYLIKGGTLELGLPTYGNFSDGLLTLEESTIIVDSIDQINSLLGDLAPPPPLRLTGDLVSSIPLYNGFLSNSTYITGLHPAGSAIQSTRENEISFTTPNPSESFGEANKGKLQFFLNGSNVDEFSLESNFDINYQDGNQIYPPSSSLNYYIRIDSVGKYNNFKAWQKGNATIRIGSSAGNYDLDPGIHKVQLKHISGGNTYLTNIKTFFYDPETSRPYIQGIPIVSDVSPIYKYLSGIKYYTTGSIFNIEATAKYIFEYTYVSNPITITFPGINNISLPYNDSSITGVSNPPVFSDDMYISKNVTITNAVSNLNSRANIIPSDPYGSGTSMQSSSSNLMIDSLANSSTSTVDSFTDEIYRLPIDLYDTIPSNITNQWNSNNLLTNGNAQVIAGLLRYPITNYLSGYRPSQSADYSIFSGNQYYYRAIYKNVAKSSGTLNIENINFSDLNTNIKIELKFPSLTGWLDLSQDFNVATFNGSNGQGIKTSYSQSGSNLIVNWSIGILNTVDSGFMYILKITFLNANKTINSIQETGW